MSATSDPLEKLQSQTDSFLTAARLLRGGWIQEGKKMGSIPAEICLKNPSSSGVPDVTKDRETRSEKKADEVKQTSDGGFLANRQRERHAGLYIHTGSVRVWVSSCRTTYRKSRRFKAPILPVISEV